MKKRNVIILLSVIVILAAGLSFFVKLTMHSQQESKRLVTAFKRVKEGLEEESHGDKDHDTGFS